MSAAPLPHRILFVAPFGLGQKTTVWARTLPLARELVAQGRDVTILIPPWDTPQDSGRCWREGGVQLINVSLGGGLPLVVGRLVRVIDRLQPDLVHMVKPRAHAGLVHWLLWQRRRLLGKGPRLFLDLDDWEQAWAAINRYPPLVARFLAWQEEWGIRHADGISAASRWLVERAQQYAPSTPVCYLPNGLSAPLTQPSPAPLTQPSPAPQILFYSRYVEVTPTWLADFWGALQAAVPTATLVVFGDALQPDRPAQFQAAMHTRSPAAANQVTWSRYDPALVDPLYATSACVIFPAEQTPLQAAKCSVRLATTLLRGVPVVASAVGEQTAYGADGAAALVAAAATPGDFAATVAQVLAQPAARLAQQRAAQPRLMRDYQWAALGARLATFYAARAVEKGKPDGA